MEQSCLQQDTQKQSRYAGLIPFKPGQTGNPGGKPVNARNALKNKFLKSLAEDFDQNGERAIQRLREESVADYIRAIVALMPKELEVSRSLDDLTDEQLAAAVIAARALLAPQDIGTGTAIPFEAQPIEVVPTVSETTGVP